MRIWLYEDVKKKVLKDLDLEDEQFITPSELMGYCNEGIDEAEAEIMKLHEDYFLSSASITLEEGESDYDLPEDIYAQKIRAMLYINGEQKYLIKRIRNFNKFLNITYGAENHGQDYCYFIKNPSVSTGYQAVLLPAAREDGAFVTLWYIRNAARITSEDDRMDIPEFVNFVIAYMKAMCLAKENAGEIPANAASFLAQQRKMMVDTLTEMVPDDDSEVPGDFSHYEEMN